MTDLEKAYLAGIIDGEGTVTLSKDGEFRYPVLTFCNNDKEIINYVNSFCPGTVSIKRAQNENWKDNWVWKIIRRQAVSVLEEITPFLHEQKKLHRAQSIIQDYIRLTPRNGKYSEDKRKEKHEWEDRFFEIE